MGADGAKTTERTLADLKAGDQVVVRKSYTRSVELVTKITPTQIVVGNTRFVKDTGWERGEGGWSRAKLSAAQHDFPRARLQMAQRKFAATNDPTREGIAATRAACDAMEAALNECEQAGIGV